MSYTHDLHNDRFYDMVFGGKREGYFIELGAYQGVMCSQTYFLETQRGWKGMVVEANPRWKEDLETQRECIVVNQPISDEVEDVVFLVHHQQPEYSKIDDGGWLPEGDIDKIPMKTVTLSSLLKEHNSPKEIDVLCIDIEGLELRVIDEVLKQSEYQINLIALEHGDTHKVIDFFYGKPYVKIKNPYLKFLRIDREKEMIVKYKEGEFYYLDGEKCEKSLLDLNFINWEYYYLHLDMLERYPSLKKLVEPIDYFNLNS